MNLIRTNTADPAFLKLERLLDIELLGEFPGEMKAYAPHNKFKNPIKAVILLQQNKALACGAFKEMKDHVEIKRMFVHPNARGAGLGKIILSALESWAQGLNYSFAILETGDTLHKAIRLYTSAGYQGVPCFGPYKDMPRSRCFKKLI